MSARTKAFVDLGDKDAGKIAMFDKAWRHVKANLGDPVALDEFSTQAATISAIAAQMANRAEQLAESLLEELED